MKKILYIILASFAISFCYPASGQNIPNGTTAPSGDTSGNITYPSDIGSIGNYKNYSRLYVPLSPMTSIPTFDNTKTLPVIITTNFNDGFDQSLIRVERNNSGKDIITPYDPRSQRVAISYLPYADSFHSKFITNVYTRQKNYYNSKYPDEGRTAYSKDISTVNSGVPTQKVYSPGKAFVGTGRGTEKTSNINGSGEVYILNYSSGNVCKAGTYASNTIWIEKVVGQHNQVSYSYTDKSGRLICKKTSPDGSTWLSTYYVYDDMGRVRCVVPPKASKQFASNTCLTNIDKLCYVFDYDQYGQVINKWTPGKTDSDAVIYDRKRRPVLSRSPLMRQRDQWTFTIYDDANRPVVTGIYTGNEGATYWRNIANSSSFTNGTSYPDSELLENYMVKGFTNTPDRYPTNIHNAVIHVYNYYDNYNYSPANLVSFYKNDSSLYLVGTAIEKPRPYMFVQSKLIASKTRILDNSGNANFQSGWIHSVMFYDEKGRVIQTQTKSIWDTTKWDVSTLQYNFAGQPVLNIAYTNYKSGSNKPYTRVLTKNTYGPMTGRLEATEQKVDTFAWQPIMSCSYDELGRMKQKWLGNVEQQNYTYNIRGQLVGTNADKLWDTTTINQTMTFWSKLSYDFGYSIPRYDGSISGFMWRSPSSKVSSYGYDYDDMARMDVADYRDYFGNAWKKTARDFSVSNISFDENGNMLSMNQRGYDTTFGPADMDILSYTYDNGNQLQKVTDGGVKSPIADFDNGSSGASTDYTYDADGNLTSDYNKNIIELTYNHQDLPVQVKKGGADKIDNIYDAGGNLLQKTVQENSKTIRYNYWGPFVFRNDSLEFFTHPEGRTRWLADSLYYKNDFFVKDHLGNVRNVITADISYADTTHYHAGFELLLANVEESIFDNIGIVRDNNPSGTPGDLESARLNGCEPDHRVGASILLHAMSGDQLNLHAYGYYSSTDTDDYNTYTPASEMLEALVSTLTGGTQIGGGEGGNSLDNVLVNNLLTSANYSLYDDLKNSITDPNYPRAYLNYLVFDESMNIQIDKCQVVQLKGTQNTWTSMTFAGNMNIANNGYLLCYLSNESCTEVFMDNENITHVKGRLLEEQHYYPHGLLVEAGGQQTTPLRNDFLYQGKKLQKELGLELYDFHARQYDPQVGRFWGIDPADQFPSGYTGMGNDPANNIDPSGMWAYTNYRNGEASIQAREYGDKMYQVYNAARFREIWAQIKNEMKAEMRATTEGFGEAPNSTAFLARPEADLSKYIKADSKKDGAHVGEPQYAMKKLKEQNKEQEDKGLMAKDDNPTQDIIDPESEGGPGALEGVHDIEESRTNGGLAQLAAGLGSSSLGLGENEGRGFDDYVECTNEPGCKWDKWGVGTVPYHGARIGGTNFVGTGPDGDPRKSGLQPVDWIDAAAFKHDLAFYNAGISGAMGTLTSPAAYQANAELLQTARNIMNAYCIGATDPITNRPVSERTYNIAAFVNKWIGLGNGINRAVQFVK